MASEAPGHGRQPAAPAGAAGRRARRPRPRGPWRPCRPRTLPVPGHRRPAGRGRRRGCRTATVKKRGHPQQQSVVVPLAAAGALRRVSPGAASASWSVPCCHGLGCPGLGCPGLGCHGLGSSRLPWSGLPWSGEGRLDGGDHGVAGGQSGSVLLRAAAEHEGALQPGDEGDAERSGVGWREAGGCRTGGRRRRSSSRRSPPSPGGGARWCSPPRGRPSRSGRRRRSRSPRPRAARAPMKQARMPLTRSGSLSSTASTSTR